MSKFKKDWVDLPESFVKGLIVDVEVSVNGKADTKQLKLCTVKAQSILFMEVDKVNRKNIFRKVKRRDIIEFRPTAICSIKIRENVLPTKWESDWDSIGSPTFRNYGRMAQAAKPFYSKHSQGWAPKLPPVQSTTNSAAGFPMV